MCPPPRAERVAADSVAEELRTLLEGRVCVLGIGNRERQDDGVGSLAAERLGARTRALVLDAGAVPENFLEKAARFAPDVVLLIDAVDFGGVPGALRVMSLEEIASSGVSTHSVSLGMLAQFLERRAGARVTLLAVQPAAAGAGSGLSAAVESALGRLVHVLQHALGPDR